MVHIVGDGCRWRLGLGILGKEGLVDIYVEDARV